RSTVRVPADLSVRRPRAVGHRNRMTYAVSALGDQAPARFTGVLTSKPFLGGTAIRALALLVVVAVWLTGVVIGVPWLSQKISGQTGEDVVAVDGGQGSPTGPDGSGGGTGGAGSGGSGGGAGGDDEDAAEPEGVRIGG